MIKKIITTMILGLSACADPVPDGANISDADIRSVVLNQCISRVEGKIAIQTIADVSLFEMFDEPADASVTIDRPNRKFSISGEEEARMTSNRLIAADVTFACQGTFQFTGKSYRPIEAEVLTVEANAVYN